MADYRHEVLNLLLERYEKSTSFTGGRGHVYLEATRDRAWFSRFESHSEKELFLAALEELKGRNLVSYTWQRGEVGNLVERVTLNLDEKALEEAYRLADRPILSMIVDTLLKDLDSSIAQCPQGQIRSFLESEKARLEKNRRLSRYFYPDETENRNLLKAVVFLSNNRTSILERMMSTRLYGDSKTFERCYRSHVLSILRQAYRDEEVESDDELFALCSLSHYPQLMMIKGRVDIHFRDGAVIDLGAMGECAYIDEFTLQNIFAIVVKDRTVLFVENKASFYDLKRTEGLTIIYQGGFFGQAKESFFRFIGENKGCTFLHFGDMDLGGFRIFVHLKRIIPSLKPYMMDRETLLANRDKCQNITNEDYIRKLASLLEDPDYEVFHSAIELMTKERIRLEQENLKSQIFDLIF